MKPSREEVLRLASEHGAFINALYACRHDNIVFTSGEFERFAAAMYEAGRKSSISSERAVSDKLLEALTNIRDWGPADDADGNYAYASEVIAEVEAMRKENKE